jgi:hypothetical protein
MPFDTMIGQLDTPARQRGAATPFVAVGPKASGEWDADLVIRHTAQAERRSERGG